MEANSVRQNGATRPSNPRRGDEVEEHLRKVDEALEELDELVGEEEDSEPARDGETAPA